MTVVAVRDRAEHRCRTRSRCVASVGMVFGLVMGGTLGGTLGTAADKVMEHVRCLISLVGGNSALVPIVGMELVAAVVRPSESHWRQSARGVS